MDIEKAGYGSEKRDEVNCVFKRMQFKAGRRNTEKHERELITGL